MKITPVNYSQPALPNPPVVDADTGTGKPLDHAYRQISDALDGLDIGVCIFDAMDRTLSWNRTFLRIFPEHDGHVFRGEPYRENLHRFYTKRLAAGELPEIERYIADGIARHRAQSQPFVFFHDGKWLRVSSLPLPEGARIRIWARIPSPGSNLAIAPGMEVAAASRHDSLENLADGVMVLDAAGKVASVNQTLLALYGFASRGVVLGRSYATLLRDVWEKAYQSPLSQELLERAIARLAEDQRFTGVSYEVPLPGERWVRVTEQHSGDGVVYSTHVDITAMKRQQAIIDEARAAAERANQAKTTFLAMMSHEVRTPMHGIIGMTELLLEAGLDETQRQYAEAVKSSAMGLLNILNDILDVSKLEIGKLTLEALEFRPAELIEDVARLLRPRSRQGGLSLDVEIDPALNGAFVGDPSRLRQVLLNLATNAVKFTLKGGVSIRATLGAGTRLRVEVADTGVGFDESRLDRLFQAFEQAETSIARRFGGTGLGLSISKQLVELMGGAIGARSRAGGGSVFWFEVPLQPGTATAPAPSIPAAEARQPRTGAASILLVEDNLTNQAVAKAILTGAGHRVTVAGDGATAVSLALAGRPDLILMDIQLPDMDGFAVTSILRKVLGESGATIPIVALTANAMAGYRDTCLAHGLNDYLAKPFTKKALLGKLAAWLPA